MQDSKRCRFFAHSPPPIYMCKKKAPFSSPPLRGGVSAKQTGWGNIFYLQIKKWTSFKKAIENSYTVEEKRTQSERYSIIMTKTGPGV